MTKHAAAADTTITEMSVEELQTRVTKARGLLAQIGQLLPGLVHLSVDERTHTNGKFQSGEPAAMKSILTAAGNNPQYFVALADKDGGEDDATFEAEPAIDDLDRMTALQDLATDAQTLAQTVSDTMLSFGASARAVGGPVHAILNANKSVAAKLATEAQQGMEFYAAHGRRASRARAKKLATPKSAAPAK